jgi:hypothetical protein
VRRSPPYVYFGVNVACALIVFVAAQRVAAQMVMEQRTSADSVDGITFMARAAPALLVGLGSNFAWAAKALLDAMRRRVYGSAVWLGAGLLMWVAIVVVGRMG